MTQTKDFLLEIGTEEMPSAPLIHATSQIADLVEKGLDTAGLAHGKVSSASTPRRLVVRVCDVALATDEVHEVKRGPAAEIAFDAEGRPTKAAAGFARKFGLDAAELTRKVDEDGREYVWAEKNVASRPATEILSEVSEAAISGLDWPNYRSQRWGAEHQGFVRPIRWICALFGSDIVPVSYADVTSSNTTQGHRVLAPGEHVVASPADFESTLESAYVLLNERRIACIREGIHKIQDARDGSVVETPKAFFDEVVNLCEWPTVLVGRFDDEFLDVPHEIITESMLTNQRYFPIYSADGVLTSEFVIVSNADPNVSETVIAGNERVVRARLDDAKFFYEEDLKDSMEDWVAKLDTVIFQEKLGSVRQKTTRMEALAAEVAQEAELSDSEQADALRAAHLAKADLVSQAVIEFTSQQGVMGGYYAEAAGENASVSRAIREHYRPRFAGDDLPAESVGICVAIADKLDTICGMFAIDEPPTGSSDPFAVRRAAIGVIAMLRELPSVRLHSLIEVALKSYQAQGLVFDMDSVSSAIYSFFQGRLATIARAENILTDTIDAISAIGVIDPVEFISRAHALDKARKSQPELFDDLATAFTRAEHLSEASLGTEVDRSIMTAPELDLLGAVEKGKAYVDAQLENGSYEKALEALADLRKPIDGFFKDVLVMDDDEAIKENRLRLLNKFTDVFKGLADIGALDGKK